MKDCSNREHDSERAGEGQTGHGNGLQVARCDLDLTTSYKTTTFNFARHRRIEAYGLITTRTGAEPPKE